MSNQALARNFFALKGINVFQNVRADNTILKKSSENAKNVKNHNKKLINTKMIFVCGNVVIKSLW